MLGGCPPARAERVCACIHVHNNSILRHIGRQEKRKKELVQRVRGRAQSMIMFCLSSRVHHAEVFTHIVL